MSQFRQHFPTVRPPSPWALSSLCGAAILALILGLAHYLDKPATTVNAEFAESQLLKDGQALEDAEAAFQAQVQKLCDTAHGPNSEVRWLPDGSLACTTRRAVVKAQVQL